jgi:hypothetical protein
MWECLSPFFISPHFLQLYELIKDKLFALFGAEKDKLFDEKKGKLFDAEKDKFFDAEKDNRIHITA